MWKFIRYGKANPLDNNIVVVGFPGMALVGKTVALQLIKALDAELYGVIYGTKFPAHLIVESDGMGEINNVALYYAKANSVGVFIATGSAQPASDVDQHSLSYFLIKQLKRYNIKELIAAAAYVSDVVVPNRKVLVVGNNIDVLKKYVEHGATQLNEGVISGLNGIVVGWAKIFNINAVCLLGETWRSIVELNYIDYIASKLVLDVINKVWNLGIDTKELEEKGRGVEREVELILKSFTQPKEEAKGEKRPYYIT
jgi:proteasome assembly chaperone (PAC2) family protein|uniref:Proteasome assembly chaperone family protein n=1 Tax=Ignisphaera aggregans TaxID=334771 RepID=A0A7J2U5G2_9CREN